MQTLFESGAYSFKKKNYVLKKQIITILDI